MCRVDLDRDVAGVFGVCGSQEPRDVEEECVVDLDRAAPGVFGVCGSQGPRDVEEECVVDLDRAAAGVFGVCGSQGPRDAEEECRGPGPSEDVMDEWSLVLLGELRLCWPKKVNHADWFEEV